MLHTALVSNATERSQIVELIMFLQLPSLMLVSAFDSIHE